MDAVRAVSQTSFLLDGKLVDIVALRAEGATIVSALNVHAWNGALNIILNEYTLWLREGTDPSVPSSLNVPAIRRAVSRIAAIRALHAQGQLAQQKPEH